MEPPVDGYVRTLPGVPATVRTKPRIIRLDGVDFKPQGPVQYELTNIHARPISLGDPGPTNHPTNATITQHSWVGGGQITYANPNSDMERFDWATAMTEYPHYLTLGPQTFTYEPVVGANFSLCLGDFPFGDDGTMWFQVDDALYYYDLSFDGLTPGPDLTVTATNTGTAYRCQDGTAKDQVLFFIPGGSGGYDIFDGTAVTHKAGITVIEFAVWDNKLFALDTGGHLYWALDPTGDLIGAETDTGINWVLAAALTDGSDPRHLVNFMNKANEATLWVITSNDAWGLDFTNKRLVKSYFGYPRHPHQGWGAEHWRGELWVSVGMGSHRYDLSQVIPSGIDRDMGPPPQFRGYVKDITGSYNLLFMYIVGSGVGATEPIYETVTLDVGGNPFHAARSSATGGPTNNLVVAWNGDGYHYRWSGQGINPGNMAVSQADDRYNVWWANDGKLYRQTIPRDYFNPLDPYSQNFTHEASSYLDTPWFDWGWTDQVKLLKRIEVGVRRASATETVELQLKIDGDDNEWATIGVMDKPGRFVFPVGPDPDPTHQTMPDGSPCYVGIAHSHFRLRFLLRRGTDATKRPVVDWWSAVGRKMLNPIRTWRFSLNLTTQQMGNYPGGAFAFLNYLAVKPEAVQFDIDNESFMVELVALAGPKDIANQEHATFMSVHLIEANDLPAATPESVIDPNASENQP